MNLEDLRRVRSKSWMVLPCPASALQMLYALELKPTQSLANALRKPSSL